MVKDRREARGVKKKRKKIKIKKRWIGAAYLWETVGSLWDLNETCELLVTTLSDGKQDLWENGAARDTGKQDPKSAGILLWDIVIARSSERSVSSIDWPGSSMTDRRPFETRHCTLFFQFVLGKTCKRFRTIYHSSFKLAGKFRDAKGEKRFACRNGPLTLTDVVSCGFLCSSTANIGIYLETVVSHENL